MSKGWHEVARLGGAGARYPHVLVDSHGWCLRLGPISRDDDKFYSRIETLLEGLVEHTLRRRLINLGNVLDPRALAEEVRDALASARDLGETAVRSIVEELSVRPPGSRNPLPYTFRPTFRKLGAARPSCAPSTKPA